MEKKDHNSASNFSVGVENLVESGFLLIAHFLYDLGNFLTNLVTKEDGIRQVLIERVPVGVMLVDSIQSGDESGSESVRV